MVLNQIRRSRENTRGRIELLENRLDSIEAKLEELIQKLEDSSVI